jgi:hypothetical protein
MSVMSNASITHATSKSASQIRLDESVFAKVKAIAQKELRTMNAQMEYFIVKGIEQYERENMPSL